MNREWGMTWLFDLDNTLYPHHINLYAVNHRKKWLHTL